ncbi:MAG: autotransporter domain-containing protein [Xanthobacteraceae bacterium]
MRGRIGRDSALRLLASTSVAALLTGGGAPSAFASGPCTPSGYSFINQTVGAISNSGAITCIYVQNSTVSGSVTNTATGMITPSPSNVPTGITINNSTIGGSVSNAGTITASSGIGIAINSNATVSGGIVNSGTISASVGSGISVSSVAQFGSSSAGGGIVNSGTISAGGDAISLSNVTSFYGGISNSGTISAGGSGIFVKTVSTFSGGISNSGTISAGKGILVSEVAVFGSGSAGGGIVNSGTISAGGTGIDVRDVTNFSGGISNSGTISASGGDGLYVYGSSVFAGGITNGGTITGVSGIVLGSGTAANSISTFTGGISNSGTIVATGAMAAAISISTIPVFTGGISNTGTISGFTGISVSGSGPASVFDSGAIVGTGGTAVDLSGNAAGNTFTLGPGYSITGSVLGQGSDTFQLGGSGNGSYDLGTFGTQYTGFTTFNVVSGTWMATGTYSQTTPVTVEGGTLLVNGNLSQASDLLVTGGTLGGTGTVGMTQIDAGGAFAPGAPGVPGTFMTVSGNLAFQSAALYVIYLNPTTSTLATVSGTASLAGTVQANFALGGYVSKQYTILTAAGGVNGTFSGISNVNLPAGTADTLSYSADDVYLNLVPGFTSYTGLTTNQQNVANALSNYFNSTGGIPGQFFALSPSGLSQVDGEAATGAEQGAFQLTTEFLDLLLDPFVNGRGNGGGAGGGGPALGFAPGQQANLPPDIAQAYAEMLNGPPKTNFDQRWGAWGAAYGGANNTSGDPSVGSHDASAQTYGFAAGMDYHFTPYATAGFAVAGGGTSWGLSNALGSGYSQAFQFGGYGIEWFGPAYFAGAVSFTNNWFTTNRTALGDQLRANFAGQTYGARFEGGYRYAVLPTLGVTPYGAVQFQDFHTPSYSENDLTGGGFGLSYNAMNATDVRTELGARFDDPTLLYGKPLILFGRLAWAHDFVSNPSLSAAFEALPGSSFTVFGAPIPHDSALTTAGLQYFLTANWQVLAKFDGEFAPGSQTYAGSGTLRYTW